MIFFPYLGGLLNPLASGAMTPPTRLYAVESKIQTPETEDPHSAGMLPDAQPQSDYYTQGLWYKSAEEIHFTVAR